MAVTYKCICPYEDLNFTIIRGVIRFAKKALFLIFEEHPVKPVVERVSAF